MWVAGNVHAGAFDQLLINVDAQHAFGQILSYERQCEDALVAPDVHAMTAGKQMLCHCLHIMS